MSNGLTPDQFRRVILASMIAFSLGGCSSDTATQAPITSINNDQGQMTSSEAMPSPPPITASEEGRNGTVPSGPGLITMQGRSASPQSSMQSNPAAVQPVSQSPRQRNAVQQPMIAAPVKQENGHIVYNRDYTAIPKGSYKNTTYTVNQGDTLFYIAWITGNDFRDLAERNHLSAPYGLNAGQIIQVGNSQGEPITGANEITEADSQQKNDNSATTGIISNRKPVAQQPVITYSDDSGNGMINSGTGTGGKFLQPRGATPGSANAPITAPVSAPTASSRSASSQPITSWRWPTKGKIIDSFSATEGGNKGIDITGTQGQAIFATAAGRVVYAGNALRGYGNLIIIKHNDDYLSAYAHNDTMLVHEQQEISAGQQIATMGKTGTSSVRLHFEIRYKGKSVNPLRYLAQR